MGFSHLAYDWMQARIKHFPHLTNVCFCGLKLVANECVCQEESDLWIRILMKLNCFSQVTFVFILFFLVLMTELTYTKRHWRFVHNPNNIICKNTSVKSKGNRRNTNKKRFFLVCVCVCIFYQWECILVWCRMINNPQQKINFNKSFLVHKINLKRVCSGKMYSACSKPLVCICGLFPLFFLIDWITLLSCIIVLQELHCIDQWYLYVSVWFGFQP